MAQSTARTGYERQLAALEEVLQTLREQPGLDVLIQVTLAFLQREFDYNLIWIALYDSAKTELVGQGGVSPTEDVAFLQQRFSLLPGDLLDQVLVQQRPAGVPDLREESRAGEWRKIAQKFNIQGTLIHPIRYRDRCLGLVLLGSHLWGGSPRSEQLDQLSILLGTLGAALYQVEVETQQQKVKGLDEPLLALLSQVGSLPMLNQRLAAVVQQTQQFLTPNRTNIYWFEPEQRYFWRLITNQPAKGANPRETQQSHRISVQEIIGFYQALTAGQIISVSEIQGTLNTSMPTRLMQQVKARSLLAAPILFQDQLFGFLAAEGNQPRIWQEEEKSYLRAAAQVVGLTAPLEPMEKVIQQTQLDQAWMSGLTHAIFNEKDFKNTLKQGIDQICKRLKVEQVFVLLYDPDTGKFAVCYQNQTRKANSLGEFLQPLSEMDWQMLEDSSAAIAIENLPEDLRLMAWRQPLLNLGVRSLLVCNTSLGQTLSGVLLVGHEASHIWNSTERRLFQDFSQQLGLILHQWQLQQQKEQQHKIHLVLQQGLTAIQKTRNLERLEQEALQHLNQLLQVPLATLVIWAPGERHGRVVSLPLTNQKFAIKSETRIDIDLDPLIQKALQQVQNGLPVDQGSGLVRLTANELAAETRAWLSGPDIGQILVMPLQATPEHEPFGVVLVADHRERSWSGLQVNASVMLINHLAWAHCSICLTEVLKQRWQALECLNWYKQRRLEDLYRVFAAGSNKLKDLISSKATGSEVHLQRVIGQMQNALALLPNLIKKEFWQLDAQQEPMALATLLKRSLDRLDPLIKQRKLWSQVHNQTNVTLSGDTSKIELVLNELLLLACGRSTPGGRIDIWCHPLDQNWLELSITDDGNIEPQLLLELHHQDQLNLLAPSSLDQPPGQHLKICHTLIQQLGGQMEMLKLEDGRLLSRLKLPLIAEQRRR